MVVSLVTLGVTVVGIILTSFFYPTLTINIRKHRYTIHLYWIIALIRALTILLTGTLSFHDWWSLLTSQNSINPIQILILFLSMSFLSIFLDELGFFAHLARFVLNRVKHGQMALFTTLYIFISILTMFTSNDIIILTLTPFILFFCKNAKISSIPYLVSEFIAANTWSMIFIIGNPTNIYLASSFNINFIEYFKVMAIPTLLTGVVEYLLLLLIFHRKLHDPLEHPEIQLDAQNKPLTIVGVVILLLCTILLILTSYLPDLHLPMYLVSFGAFFIEVIVVLIYYLSKKEKPVHLTKSFRRLPYEIIPFILAMFTLVLSLQTHGVTSDIAHLFPESGASFTFGYSSMIMANFMNNIPMSVLYTSICSSLPDSIREVAIYSSIVGSNIGAFITPFGALAGIIWLSILKKYEVSFTFRDFFKYGLLVGLPSISVTLVSLLLFI